jgi:hypothetical protein
MSMSAEQEDFENLRRLLALKRHEQPPPGYFNNFSRKVIARIHSEEATASQSWGQRIFGGSPFFRNFWEGFEAKPLVAGAFGIGICSLLVMGLVSSERVDADPAGFTGTPSASQTFLATMPKQTFGTSLYESASADHSLTSQVYTAQQNRSSIFEELQRPHAQPVNFARPAN